MLSGSLLVILKKEFAFLSRLFIKCELPEVNFRSLDLQSAKLR